MYSMLDGDALTAVEHLEVAEFLTEGCENLILHILEAKYPDKDPTDPAGKALFDVFEVSAREGERLSEWSARAESVFHPCQRHAGIAFPDMVKGYLCLQSSGAGLHWRQVRNCIVCNSSEVVLSGVPNPTAQSKVSRSVRIKLWKCSPLLAKKTQKNIKRKKEKEKKGEVGFKHEGASMGEAAMCEGRGASNTSG